MLRIYELRMYLNACRLYIARECRKMKKPDDVKG